MAFARHNIEKHRLIELVRMNPILWDCRLPHYKRSDKKKAIKWNELGRVFSVNGERVQRTFTSLREIFRRELNHEKLLGTRFKSKWEYYEAMAFLKEVIRERKSRERAKSESIQQQQPNSSSNGIDEYQYFAPNDPNNPNNQPQQQQQMQEQQEKCEQQQQQQLLLPPDVILNVNATQLQQQLQKLTSNVLQSHLQQQASPKQAQQQEQQATIQPDLLSSSNSGSSSPSIYIKDEPDSQDETISVSTTNNERQYGSSKTATTISTTTINCEQVSTTATHVQRENMASSNNNNNNDYNNKNIVNNNIASGSKLSRSQQHVAAKQRRSSYAVAAVNSTDADCLDDDIDNDVDDADLDDDLDDADDIDDIVAPVSAGDGRMSAATIATLRRRRESPREILYNKFGDFLAARLNTLNETVANELMNKILMLIAEK